MNRAWIAPFLLVATAAAAQPSFEEAYAPVADTPGFAGLREELQRTLDWFGTVRVNHYCIVMRSLRDTGETRWDRSAVVYWQEGRQIQAYGQGYPDARVDSLLTNGQLHVDLKDGVVPTDDDINGSTFLVSRPWVNALIRACWRRGTPLTLIRHPRRYDPARP